MHYITTMPNFTLSWKCKCYVAKNRSSITSEIELVHFNIANKMQLLISRRADEEWNWGSNGVDSIIRYRAIAGACRFSSALIDNCRIVSVLERTLRARPMPELITISIMHRNKRYAECRRTQPELFLWNRRCKVKKFVDDRITLMIVNKITILSKMLWNSIALINCSC